MLTPKQVGLLAEKVEETLKKYPSPDDCETEDSDEVEMPALIQMERWEEHLRELVSMCDDLPSYEKCTEDGFLFDALLSHFE